MEDKYIHEPDSRKLAVLIDADNISAKNIKAILDEITNYGVPTIKRIYGDWTSNSMNSWKKQLLEHSLTPMQQYAYTTGKNATDAALIIDAMDILHREHIDGFCIVSSDSDFTKLASRLRESGKVVIGIGERKTPAPFIASCDQFIYVEILQKAAAPPKTKSGSASKSKKASQGAAALVPAEETEPETTPILPVDEDFKQLLRNTVEDLSDETGRATLGGVGTRLRLKRPDFDPRNYGYSKMLPFIKSMPELFEIEIEEVNTGKNRVKHVYIKNR